MNALFYRNFYGKKLMLSSWLIQNQQQQKNYKYIFNFFPYKCITISCSNFSFSIFFFPL